MFSKFKAMFGILLAVSSATCAADLKAPVDMNKPVENPALVTAIQRVATDGSNTAKDQLLFELQRANYLAAMLDVGLKKSPSSKVGETTIQKGSTFGVLSAGKAGKNYLVLFTDWKALQLYTNQKVSGWVLPSKDAWAFALQGKTYDGVVINPAHNALPLERPMLEFLARDTTKKH